MTRDHGRGNQWMTLACWTAAALGAVAAMCQRTAAAPSNSPPEALGVYRDAAAYQNRGEFSVAAEEWAKFLIRFPGDPLAAKAQHYLGVCHLQLKHYDRAAVAFEAMIKEYPGAELRENAYLNLGWCQYTMARQGKTELYAQAAQTFQAMVKQFPKETGKRTDEGLFYLGESLFGAGKKRDAADTYARLVREHTESSLRSSALYAMGVALEELGEFADAGKAYDAFIESYGENDLITEVRMRKAETVLQAGLAVQAKRPDEAKASLKRASQMFAEVAATEGFAFADHAIFRQAFSVLKQDQMIEAAQLYCVVADRFPGSDYRDECVMNAARCFYRGEKYEDAATRLQQVLSRGGGDAPEAAHWLCRIHLKRGQPERALELTSQMLAKAADSSHLVHLKMDQADCLHEFADRRAESIEKYLRIAAEHPKDPQAPQAVYNAAFTLMEVKRYPEGLEQAAAFIAAFPKHLLVPDVKYVAAECHLQLQDYAQAERGYRDVIASHAEHVEIGQWRVRLGLVLYLQRRYEDAVAALEPLTNQLKDAGQIAEVQFLLGASRFHLGQFDPAVKALRASLLANAKWRQADETLLYLSRAQYALDEPREAKATVEMLLDTFPNSQRLDQAYYRLGEYCYALEDFDGAVEAYGNVIDRWASSAFTPYAYYGKGWGQLKSAEYGAAEVVFTELLEKHPRHELAADAHLARGMCRRQTGRCEDAIADFGTFLKSDPELAEKSNARYELALAYVGIEKREEAVDMLSALLNDDPEYANADKALYELAWAHKSLGKPNESVAAFRKLAADHPKSSLAAEAHFHVGEVLYEKSDYAEARKAYEESKRKAEDGDLGQKATYKLGWTLYHLKRYDSALTEFSQHAKVYPQSGFAADSLFMKAECMFRLEDYKAALPAFTAARQATSASQKTDPKIKVLVLLHGGQTAAQLKQWQRSLEFLEAIPAHHPKTPLLPEALYEIGWAKHHLGLLDQALTAFEQAADGSRGEVGARARFMMGEVCFLQKKHEEAMRHFVRVMYGFGGEAAEAKVKTWQAKAGFEAARCAEVRMRAAGEPAEQSTLLALARKYYAFVVEEHSGSDLAADAKKRLGALADM